MRPKPKNYEYVKQLTQRIKELLAKHDWDETIIKELEAEVANLKESRDNWKDLYRGEVGR